MKISGYLALFFGTIAVLFTLQSFSSPSFLMLALPAGVLGYIASIAYIFIKTKREVKTGIFNQGIVGMLLSSVPVAVILYYIITASK